MRRVDRNPHCEPYRPLSASQPIEKCEQSIAGFETSSGHARGFDCGQCPLLHREVRGEILVSGRGALVPEPQRDHGKVDAGLQQMHRRCVTERLQRDPLGFVAYSQIAAAGGCP